MPPGFRKVGAKAPERPTSDTNKDARPVEDDKRAESNVKTSTVGSAAQPAQPAQPATQQGAPLGTLDDAAYQRAIQLQQSAYQPGSTQSPSPGPNPEKKLTVKRSGGGRKWQDPSLLEWDPKHFRLFVGNLSPEVTDAMLEDAFKQYPSLTKVKSVLDHKTQKNKGYGFVAFSDPEDYFQAFKTVNGKYIGNHPVQLKRSNTDIKPTSVRAAPYKRRH